MEQFRHLRLRLKSLNVNLRSATFHSYILHNYLCLVGTFYWASQGLSNICHDDNLLSIHPSSPGVEVMVSASA